MRDRQAEPRYFVYVYDYSENKTKIMKRRKLLEKRGEYQAFTPSRHNIAELHLWKTISSTGDSETNSAPDSEKIEQAPIPSKGSLAISTGDNGFGGGETVVARVHINLALRLQKWLGLQQQLYIVDDMKPDRTSEARCC